MKPVPRSTVCGEGLVSLVQVCAQPGQQAQLLPGTGPSLDTGSRKRHEHVEEGATSLL